MYYIPTIHMWSIKVMRNNISTKNVILKKWIDSLFYESAGHVFFFSYLDSDQNISTTIEWIYMKYHIYS